MSVFRSPFVKAQNRPVTGFYGVGVQIHHERRKTPHGANLGHCRPCEPSAPVVHGMTCPRSPPRVTDHPRQGQPTHGGRATGRRQKATRPRGESRQSCQSWESRKLPESRKSLLKVDRESKSRLKVESRESRQSRESRPRELIKSRCQSRESRESGESKSRSSTSL